MHSSAGNIKILAGKLFDSYAGDVVRNRVITVSANSGLIVGVEAFEDAEEWFKTAGIDLTDESTIDLRDQTVLPGFVDAHVHREYICLRTAHDARDC
jgi:cytosine/adenosine deaminase-related metal-dependent hydrolase